MPDSVAYTLRCFCGELIYAGVQRDFSGAQGPGWRWIQKFWPDLHHPNPHDPIERCPGCNKPILQLQEELALRDYESPDEEDIYGDEDPRAFGLNNG